MSCLLICAKTCGFVVIFFFTVYEFGFFILLYLLYGSYNESKAYLLLRRTIIY